MTGPRSATVRPHRTRARPLLPFLAAIMLSTLACSESPITEPSDTSVAPSSTRLHPYLRTNRSADLASARFYRSSALVRLGTANITSGGSVLLIADEDGPSTTALANSVASAGYVVTL